MCGIAGVVTQGKPVERSCLEAMMQSLAHRGPDGEGMYLDGAVGLGHRRLAIIDPEGGRQPLSNEDGSVWVTFNGCIYNYQELARDLRAAGHTFRTHSDTEVIVHAYEQWGTACVTHFNGMFAFAIWDGGAQRLFAARDRLGIKPFYYVAGAEAFAFASEIKALIAGGCIRPELDPRGLQDYLTFQFCLDEKTLFRGVQRLPPGHALVMHPGDPAHPQVFEYWDLQYDYDSRHPEEYFVDHLKFLLEDAVRLQLRSDVPLGAHLSGGLDSATVVCLTARLLDGQGLKTFTGAFDEGRAFDETPFARLIAKAAGADYHEVYLTSQDFADTISKLIWHMDEPAAGPGLFPQYFVSRLARQHVKVVLGGQGGDELFLGYARYLIAYLEQCFHGAILETADQDRYAVTLESIIPNLPTLRGYQPLLQHFWKEGLFEDGSRRYFRLIDRGEGMAAVVNQDAIDPTYSPYESFYALYSRKNLPSLINRMTYFDLKASLPALLQVEDRTSMAVGLESRVPLLDHRIVELMATVPPAIKFKGGRLKHLFREAVKQLVPVEILARKDKMGFPVPLSQWYHGGLCDFGRDILLSRRTRERGIFHTQTLEHLLEHEQPFSRVIWGVLCLELWHREFVDGS
ncbi:MAG: asparagine synthase (glutamine-hydrolyzing) [Candidatus Methylomirabilis oxyfera]|nr:asparagine synthase (glutamine-hydrolyzing) [Candidatus Methylomirabilis oxyfera]